MAALVKYA